MIASKPHRGGSDWTPWHDELDPFTGHVRYFGDDKADFREDPAAASGNRAVLEQFRLIRGVRDLSGWPRHPHVLFFEGVVHEGHEKGFWRFIGIGILERAELLTQVDRHGRVFTNYAFDCVLIDLAPEQLQLSWEWIAARRDPTWSLEDALTLAPENWKRWVDQGATVIDRVRQWVARYRVLEPNEQRPEPGSPADTALKAVIQHYKTGGTWSGVGEHRFEGLASEVAGTLFSTRPGATGGDGSRDEAGTVASISLDVSIWARRTRAFASSCSDKRNAAVATPLRRAGSISPERWRASIVGGWGSLSRRATSHHRLA